LGGRGLPEEDSLQVGRVAFLRAVDRFRPELGNRLVTFAVPWIDGAVRCLSSMNLN
jgi:DNA-directed RNA polymerase specialized sigma subunit